MHVPQHVCRGQGQLAGTGSPLSPRGFWGITLSLADLVTTIFIPGTVSLAHI